MSNSKYRVVVFGASGNLGNRIVHQIASRGHAVTAFVRDEGRFRASLDPSVSERVAVITGDALNADDVARAIEGHGVAVNAAGTPMDVPNFKQVVSNVVSQAGKHLNAPRRLFVTGGILALSVPKLNVPGATLPGAPAVYMAHVENNQTVAASSLDWTFLCPGPLNPAADGKANPGVRAFADTVPVDIPDAVAAGPREGVFPVIAKNFGRFIVTYDDVAEFVAEHLDPNGPFSRKSVGFVLPDGQTASKIYPANTPQAAIFSKTS